MISISISVIWIKLNKVNAVQYLTESRSNYNKTNNNFDFQSLKTDKSGLEESKNVEQSVQQENPSEKTKFEKYIMLFLISSNDMSQLHNLRKRYVDDFKEIVNIMKIN